ADGAHDRAHGNHAAQRRRRSSGEGLDVLHRAADDLRDIAHVALDPRNVGEELDLEAAGDHVRALSEARRSSGRARPSTVPTARARAADSWDPTRWKTARGTRSRGASGIA